jgi:hypothetical protein
MKTDPHDADLNSIKDAGRARLIAEIHLAMQKMLYPETVVALQSK